jgi:leucyl aminopeptidase
LAFYAGAMSETDVEAAGLGLMAGAWDFRELKTAPPADEQRAALEEATILTADVAARTGGARVARAIGEGHSLARRLGMLPGNICTPDYLAATAKEIADRYSMQLTVLGRKEMERERMGSFLCVAQGTSQDPKLIAMEYRRGPKDAAPIVLVGKGLCFDSGGISIKPAQGMEWMKFDMCGAAGVLGAMEAIGRLELPVNVVGLIGSTTNMVSGDAVKPGDVVQASNGKYIEIINTDAEGRLVLADVLVYAKRFNPSAVIDAATLTGACVIALGHTATGVMGSDDTLVQEVLDAAKRAGEPGWPLPLWDDYKELIKSDVADIKNSGGRPAGTITAALFLKEFAEGYPWVHLDVAGTAYTESDLGTVPRGSTGVPVGTFVEFVRGRTR